MQLARFNDVQLIARRVRHLALNGSGGETCPPDTITGSSGAGTTTVTTTFQQIFRREGVKAVIVHGDAFHRYDRNEMRVQRAATQNNGQMHFSRFGPEANLFEELETLFCVYGESGTGKVRKYVHDEEEAETHQQEPGPSRRGRRCRQTVTCFSMKGCMEQSSPIR